MKLKKSQIIEERNINREIFFQDGDKGESLNPVTSFRQKQNLSMNHPKSFMFQISNKNDQGTSSLEQYNPQNPIFSFVKPNQIKTEIQCNSPYKPRSYKLQNSIALYEKNLNSQQRVRQIEEQSSLEPQSSRNITEAAFIPSVPAHIPAPSNFKNNKPKNQMNFQIYFKILKAVRQFKSLIVLRQIPPKAFKLINDLSFFESTSGIFNFSQSGQKKTLFSSLQGQSNRIGKLSKILKLQALKLLLYFLNLLDKYLPVIDPFNMYRILFDVVLIIVVIFSVFTNTLEAFFDLKFYDLYPKTYPYVNLVIIIIFFINVVLNLNTGIYQKGIITKSRTNIFSYYLQNRVISDVLSIISLFNFPSDSFFFKFLKLLILLKIPLVTSKLDLAMQVTQTAQSYGQLYHFIRLAKLLLTILCVAHFVAISFYGQALLSDQVAPDMNSWIKVSKLVSLDDFWIKKYIFSFYFSVTTMVTVGYGDITPINQYEALIVIISMVIASGIFAYTFNLIGSIVSDMNKKEKTFKKKMSMLNIYLTDRNIEQDLRYQVQKYLEYKFQSNQQLSKQEEEKVLSDLSTNLFDKINFQAKKKVLNKGNNIFSIFSQQIRDLICLELKEFRPSKDEIIFEQEVVYEDPKMYFVHRGSVDIFSKISAKKEHEGLVLNTLQTGQYFGEISFFTNQSRACSARVSESSILFSLSQSDFLKVLKTDSHELQKFYQLKQKLIFNKSFSVISNQCYQCTKETHNVNFCPFLHFQPDKELVILKQNYSFPAQRFKQSRQRVKECSLYHLTEKKNEAQKIRRHFRKKIIQASETSLIESPVHQKMELDMKLVKAFDPHKNTLLKLRQLYRSNLKSKRSFPREQLESDEEGSSSELSKLSSENDSENSETSSKDKKQTPINHTKQRFSFRRKSEHLDFESIPNESPVHSFDLRNTQNNQIQKITEQTYCSLQYTDQQVKSKLNLSFEEEEDIDDLFRKTTENGEPLIQLELKDSHVANITNISHQFKELEDSHVQLFDASKNYQRRQGTLFNKREKQYNKQSNLLAQIGSQSKILTSPQGTPKFKKRHSTSHQLGISSQIWQKNLEIDIPLTQINLQHADKSKITPQTDLQIPVKLEENSEKNQFVYKELVKFDQMKEFESYFPLFNYKNIIQSYNKLKQIQNAKLPSYFGVYSFVNRKDRKARNKQSNAFGGQKKFRQLNTNIYN